jgi:hypothetical protein
MTLVLDAGVARKHLEPVRATCADSFHLIGLRASAGLCLRRELEPALTLDHARVRQPCHHIAVASVRRAPASEHQPAQLIERREQRRVLAQPPFIQRDALASHPVRANHERVAPLRGSHPPWVAPYIYVVALALE